jgi:hypothetical protein
VDAQFIFLGLFLRSSFPAEEVAAAAVHFQDLCVGVAGDVQMAFMQSNLPCTDCSKAALSTYPRMSFCP